MLNNCKGMNSRRAADTPYKNHKEGRVATSMTRIKANLQLNYTALHSHPPS